MNSGIGFVPMEQCRHDVVLCLMQHLLHLSKEIQPKPIVGHTKACSFSTILRTKKSDNKIFTTMMPNKNCDVEYQIFFFKHLLLAQGRLIQLDKCTKGLEKLPKQA